MNALPEAVAVVGAGRMGEGIALAFAQAGVAVELIDIKAREPAQREDYFERVRANLRGQLDLLRQLGLLDTGQAEAVLRRVVLTGRDNAALQDCPLVFEAVPEVLATKRETFAWLGTRLPATALIASTTSTFLVTELAGMVERPQRFLNAHWLNPAQLMPLVEVSHAADGDPQAVAWLMDVLRAIGKVPVRCAPSAGYIVPRIQALAMNEAARLVEEGVASAEDVDTAVRVGFGLRFSTLGLLEFIDWGGGDILHYASRYLAAALDPRFAAPAVIEANMREGRNGLRDGEGFYDYAGVDVEAYKARRMGELVERLRLAGLLPKVA